MSIKWKAPCGAALALCVASVVGTPMMASATTFAVGDLDSYAEAADLIIEGRVGPGWTSHGETALPMTYHRVEITRTWKGEVESMEIILQYPGGWSDTGAWVAIPGTPRLTEGAWVLAFARADASDAGRASIVHWTTGLLQSHEGDDPGAAVLDGRGRPLAALPRTAHSARRCEPADECGSLGHVPWHELQSVLTELTARATGLPGARVAGAPR